MAPFDDYHRTVVGYHGTGLMAALRIVNRIEDFRGSQRRDYDWLGRGIYFWEYAPKQALTFATMRSVNEVNDVCEALQLDVTGVEPENPQGESQAQADAEGAAD